MQFEATKHQQKKEHRWASDKYFTIDVRRAMKGIKHNNKLNLSLVYKFFYNENQFSNDKIQFPYNARPRPFSSIPK